MSEFNNEGTFLLLQHWVGQELPKIFFMMQAGCTESHSTTYLKYTYRLFADQGCVEREEVCASLSVGGDEDWLWRGRAHGRWPAQTQYSDHS